MRVKPSASIVPCSSMFFHQAIPLIVLMLCVPLCVATAQTEPGGLAGAPFRRTLLPSEASLAGASHVVFPDATTLLTNSAALARTTGGGVAAAISLLPFQQQQQTLCGSYAIDGVAGFGLGITRYGVSGIAGRTITGQKLGELSSQDLAVAVGAGLNIGPGNVGASVRYLRRDVSGIDAPENGYSVGLSGSIAFQERLFISTSLSNVAGGMIASYQDGPKEVIPWHGRFGAAYLLPFSEPELEEQHPDPSGQIHRESGPPKEYLIGTVEATMGQFSKQPAVSIAAECVPYRGIDLGFRLGFSSVGDAAFGLFLTPPIDSQNLRLDFAARRDYEFGGITWHVMISKRFAE